MSFWENISKIQRAQTEKGIKTYGQTLEQNNGVSTADKIRYIEEELVDALMYLEWLKADIMGSEVPQE